MITGSGQEATVFFFGFDGLMPPLGIIMSWNFDIMIPTEGKVWREIDPNYVETFPLCRDVPIM